MSVREIPYPTLISTLWPAEPVMRTMRVGALAMLGAVLLTVSAKLQIPFYPVPMTMQTFVVLVLGTAYGARLGAATVGVYLVVGALGLPVFAGTPEKGIGLAYLVGPTSGYLVGFVLAAWLCGWLAERGWDRSVLTAGMAMIAGNVAIYVPGLIWLGALFGWDKPILASGLAPFVLGDLTKLVLAAALMPLAWRLLGRRGERPSD